MTVAKDPPAQPAPGPGPRRSALWPFRPAPRGERVNEHVRDEPAPPVMDLRRLARLVGRGAREGGA